MKTFHMPATGHTVTIRQYCQAIRLAKKNPDAEFKHGLTTWWPTTGKEIMRQFFEGVNDRINKGGYKQCH